METLIRHRPVLRTMFSDTELAKRDGCRQAISFLLQTPSISDVWFHRLFTMYMHMQKCMQTVESQKVRQINVVVPTGNFGNILAAFYAKNMGLPIAKLICASNENKVLYDFFSHRYSMTGTVNLS